MDLVGDEAEGEMKISTTKWFRLVSTRAAALAKVRGVRYPGSPEDNSKLHAEVEHQLGSELKRKVQKEMGWD